MDSDDARKLDEALDEETNRIEKDARRPPIENHRNNTRTGETRGLEPADTETVTDPSSQ